MIFTVLNSFMGTSRAYLHLSTDSGVNRADIHKRILPVPGSARYKTIEY